MTLIETIDAARHLLNEDLDSARTYPDNTSSFFKDATLQRYYNMVQSEIQNTIQETFEDYFLTSTFLSISAGTAEYALPSGTIKIRRVEDTRGNGRPTEILPVTINHKEEGIALDRTSVTIGGGYYIAGTQLVLTNTPSFTNASAIRLHYTKKLPDVTSATDTSEIPPEYHHAFVFGIVKYGLFQQQSDTTKAELEYEKQLARLKKHAETRQIQRPRRVKSFYHDEN